MKPTFLVLLLVSLSSALDAPQVDIQAECDGVNTTVTLFWDAVDFAERYELYRQNGPFDELQLLQSDVTSPHIIQVPTEWDWQYQLPSFSFYSIKAIGSDPQVPEFVAFYPFDNTCNNQISNQYNCTLYGGIYMVDRFGHSNSACSLDGVNDYVLMSEPIISPTISICLWMKALSYSPARSMTLIRHRTHGYNIMLLPVEGELRLYTEIWASNGIRHIYTSPFQINNTDWHHVALTYDGHKAKTYYDGQLVNTTSEVQNFSQIFFGQGATAFGRDGDYSDRYFYGILDDIYYYNYEIDDNDVISLYLQE